MAFDGSTTIGPVLDRVSSVVVASGYVRSNEYFGFDRQPNVNLDRVFRVTSGRVSSQGYLGMAQMEVHNVEVWVALKVAKDPHGAARQMQADLSALEVEIYADETDSGDLYYVQDDGGVQWDIQPPPDGGAFIVGHMSIQMEIERRLT